MKKKVYAFDFDGTLTTKDTLLEFIRYARGTWAFLWGFLLHSPLLVAMKLKLYPNWKAKQRIFSYYFKGMAMADFDAVCQTFAKDNRHLMRPKAVEYLQKVVTSDADVVIVSASIVNWVTPFFDEFGQKVRFACTQVEEKDGVLTGCFLTANCYGTEKVHRIKELFPRREEYTLVAFGDSRGDKELLEEADAPNFRKFN